MTEKNNGVLVVVEIIESQPIDLGSRDVSVGKTTDR